MSKRYLSIKARKAIAQAQKVRWAKYRAEQVAEKPKRKVTRAMLKAMRRNAKLARAAARAAARKNGGYKRTPAQRRAISKARKAYWAARRHNEKVLD